MDLRSERTTVYGVDFTSAPCKRKPLTVAQASCKSGHLTIDRVARLEAFAPWEALLASPGPWMMGCDFPFGQPRRLLENLGWDTHWVAYVAIAAGFDMLEWADVLAAYRSKRPVGDKEHLRKTDRWANARSPMKTVNPPIAKMFLQGAPRLLRTPVSILPCRPTTDDRLVVEVYPSLVVRNIVGRASYKNDTRSKQTGSHLTTRDAIIAGLKSVVPATYGITVEYPNDLGRLAREDATGDTLDAMLCAIQAAWSLHAPDHGISAFADPNEGCIADPTVRRTAAANSHPLLDRQTMPA
ncbi:MAG: hypothetical protein NVS2B7_39510 [Herpetosiphon sp.]